MARASNSRSGSYALCCAAGVRTGAADPARPAAGPGGQPGIGVDKAGMTSLDGSWTVVMRRPRRKSGYGGRQAERDHQGEHCLVHRLGRGREADASAASGIRSS